MPSPAISAAPEDWARVGQAVRERRLALDLGQDALGVSKAVASKLENAHQTSFTRASLARVSRALGWSPDSIERMLRGEDPIEAAHDATRPLVPRTQGEVELQEAVDRLTGEVADLRRQLEDLRAERAGRPARPPSR